MDKQTWEDLVIRPLNQSDISSLSAGFAAQGWNKPESQYEDYLRRQQAGEHQVLVGELDGKPVGYLLVLPCAKTGPFAGQGIPEIVDFNVLQKYQHHGIGNRLMDAAERLAGASCDRVCLGVGLHAGYGTAQRMYLRRGYLFDGSGVWYRDQPLAPYASCVNDDDLVLYLSKPLFSR